MAAGNGGHEGREGAISRILVDGDACPVREEISDAAGFRGIEVLIFATFDHLVESRVGTEVRMVDPGRDAVDFAIVEESREGDLVITDDTGLAAMVLPRGVRCISFRGKEFLETRIELQMARRHIAAAARRRGGRSRRVPRFDDRARTRFRTALVELLDET